MFSIQPAAATIVKHLAVGLIVAALRADGAVAAQAATGAGPQEAPAPASDAPPRVYEEVVVTASARNERLGDTAATMQVLGRDEIAATSASTLTDLLAQYGVVFLSQWTPAQTSINLRGASTDGQGKDFRSQVVILINGRRAGTANISKLSLQDVERIEIVRGPGSLLYGSQAIGGVVNLLTRSGVRGAARGLNMNFGSFGQIDGGGLLAGQSGKLDYSVSVHGGRRGDYTAGSGSPEPMTNTSYSQRGGLFELGYSRSARERVSATVRSDEPARAAGRAFPHVGAPQGPVRMWSLGGTLPLGQGLQLRATANNLLDANVHSTFIATDTTPFLGDARFSNGGHGNSLPGRNIVFGLEWRR